MTTSKQEEIEVLISNELDELSPFGFSQSEIRRNQWSTSIVTKLEPLALEVEIDWREGDIFLLVARLKDGKMPSGYYLSEGMPVRYHLSELIAEKGWAADTASLKLISQNFKDPRKRSSANMIEKFFLYRKVLDSCVKQLVDEKKTVF